MQSNYNNLEHYGVGIRPEIETDFTVTNGKHQEITGIDFGEGLTLTPFLIYLS